MKISTILVVFAFALTATAHVEAKAHGRKSPALSKPRSNSVVVDAPSDLPELAQSRSDGMFLNSNGSGQSFLYLEQDHGKSVTILDVSNPGSIREARHITVNANSSYDFVEYLGKSLVLIRYRDGSGYAALNVGKNNQPVLTAINQLPNTTDVQSIENIDQRTLLFTSTSNVVKSAPESQVEVIDFSNPSAPVRLAVVRGVTQKIVREDTGTLFLLGDNGLTVVRRPSLEEEFQIESTYVN